MSKRKWGYGIRIGDKAEGEEESMVIADMELTAISPYNLDAGNRLDFGTLSESEALALTAGPMTMGIFIEKIGDQNVLSFKKLSDETSVDLLNAKINQTAYSYALLYITALTKISSKLRGSHRRRQMFIQADAYLVLASVSVTFAWTKIQEKGKAAYDLITLSCRDIDPMFFDK